VTDDTPGEEPVDPAELAAELAAEVDDDSSTDGVDTPTAGSEASADGVDESSGGVTQSTFVVTHSDDDSAMLRDTATGQVHTLSENPDLDAEAVVEATIAPEPPMGVTYELRAVTDERSVRIEAVGEKPTTQARRIARDQEPGEVTRQERAGDGEFHVITVPEGQTEIAVEDVLNDRETRLLQAARAGASLVEVRSEPGVVSVRYLP
jgi:hypothetical protein